MSRVKKYITRLFIIFISVMLIDGGKTFIIAGSNITFIIKHKHNNDNEVPFHESLNLPADNEVWIEPDNHKTIFASVSPANIIYTQNFKTREFSKSIWQPPKSI
jgi:hypothetical protein